MPSPKIVKQEGNYVLVETDFKLTNLTNLTAYRAVYGDYPIVFKKYNTSIQSNWFIEGNPNTPNLYIFATGDATSILSRYTNSTTNKITSEEVAAFAARFYSVVCIGTEAANGGKGFTERLAAGAYKVSDLFNKTTPPKLEARGYLDYFDPRLGGNAKPLVFSDNLKLYPNSTIEEVTEAWNRYNDTKGLREQLVNYVNPNQLRENGTNRLITTLLN